jgi:hypothetical protein
MKNVDDILLLAEKYENGCLLTLSDNSSDDKHRIDFSKKANDKIIDLSKADDFSFSAIMRKLREQASEEQVREFLKLFKSCFDKAVQRNLENPEKVALQNSIIAFSKNYKIKLSKDLVKNATVSELGEASRVGKYLADIIRFTLTRISPDRRLKAINSLKHKIYGLNENDIANKNLPASSAMGQSITFVKHVLFNHNPIYIRDVLNNIVRYL